MKAKSIFVLSILLSMFFLSFPVNAPSIPQQYVYVDTYTDVYQINSSTDDAYLKIDLSYHDDTGIIPMKNQYDDMYVGLRFPDVYVTHNDTHTFQVVNAYFSFYSTQSYQPDYPCQVTFYYINEDNPLTFSNYSDLLGRPYWNNPFNWDGEEIGGSQWVNTTNFNDLIHSTVPHDTARDYAFRISSAEGEGFRYFTSYDGNASLAPRLIITWSLYEIVSEHWIENYRGYDIYGLNESEWIDYETFTKDGNNKGNLDLVNSDLVNYSYNWVRSSHDIILVKNWASEVVDVKFGYKIDDFQDVSGVGERYWHVLYGGHGGYGRFQNNSYDYWGLVWWSDLNAHKTELYMYFYDQASGDVDDLSWTHSSFPTTTYWVHLRYNNSDLTYVVEIFDDYNMTNRVKLATGSNNLRTLNLTWEYGYQWINVAPYDQGKAWLYSQGVHQHFWVVDDNGTQISPTFDEIQDARDWIDRQLDIGGLDKLENLGSNMIAWLGIAGLLMIPLSFILFISNAQAGNWSEGFYVGMSLFFVGLGLLINWLWA